MIDYRCKLENGKFYHIFNRGIDGVNIFYNTENYKYFLRKYDLYLSPFLQTFSFCLLPNHFHLLVRLNDTDLNVSFRINGMKHLDHLDVGNVKHFKNVSH